MALKNIKWPNYSNQDSAKNLAPKAPVNKIKWRTIVGLLIAYGAAFLNWQWIWGIFCLYWIIPDFFTGVTHFVEPVYRKENPILFWFILITWIAFSVALFFPAFS
ncbi:MAG: hypothetical protein AAF889_05770 [Cyanobacteria bacterium P01_D01_bin.73]